MRRHEPAEDSCFENEFEGGIMNIILFTELFAKIRSRMGERVAAFS